MRILRWITGIFILSSFVVSCQENSSRTMQSAVESFLLCNTNFILSPISDSSIVRKGYYGFNDSVIPKELYLKDSDAAINSLMSIPRYSKVLETEWRPEGMYFELSDGHAICFHDTTSLAFMLVENGIVRNTIEYKIEMNTKCYT